MAEESSVIKLTHWKLRRVGFFSLTLFSSLSLSLSHSLSLSLSLSQINLFYFTLFTLVINSVELIWTSPFQKYFIQPRSCLTSPLSHIHLWLSWCATWLGLFFVPFFDHIMSVRMITSQAVSEWVRINVWALAAYINSLGDHFYSLTLCLIPTTHSFYSHSHSHTLTALYSI